MCEELGESGKVYEALKLVEELKDKTSWWRDDMLQSIPLGISKSGNAPRAINIAQKIKDETTRSYTLKQIAEGLLKKGQVETVMEKFLPLLEVKAHCQIDLLELIMKLYIERGLFERAAAVAEEQNWAFWLLKVHNAI